MQQTSRWAATLAIALALPYSALWADQVVVHETGLPPAEVAAAQANSSASLVYEDILAIGTDEVEVDIASAEVDALAPPIVDSAPEPSNLFLLGLGLVALTIVRRRTLA